MPTDQDWLNAGTAIMTQAGNIASQAGANRQQRKFSEHMYDKSRNDALTDRAFENDYNSPAAQMARLTKAGLNPNLVYGNGASQSQSVHTGSAQQGSSSPKAGQVDLAGLTNAFMAIFIDSKKKEAETDNTRAVTELMKEKTLSEILAQRSQKVGIDRAKNQFEIEQYLKPDLQARGLLQNEKLAADIQFTQDANMRAAAMSSQSVAESVERMLKLRAERENLLPLERERLQEQIKNLQQDTRIKTVQAKLTELGINPHDPTWMRIMGNIATELWNDSTNTRPSNMPERYRALPGERD